MVISEAYFGTSYSLEYPHDLIHDSITTRVRRSVRSEAPRTVSYSSQVNKKIKVKGDTADYLQVSPANDLIVGPQSQQSAAACFQLHTFDVLTPYPEGGQVVVFQTHDGSHFLHGDASGSLSLRQGSSEDLQEVTSTDDRFFLLYNDAGDRYSKIKHIHTGLFLSATYDSVSLVSHSGGFSDHMLFESFQCSHS
ncbi:uncharacterized protein [Procambarus clarkii]|uniref:uncharacterized protein n=1 Tax=Procambarus clarkii TaxID=6728 RepID=UPI001E67191F|nr:uncharacterized protein LOC123746547 [Procambarus clarkii]